MLKNYLLFSAIAMLSSGCLLPETKGASNSEIKEAETFQDLTPNALGPRIAFVVRDPKDPGVQRELNQAREAAVADHTHLYAFMAPTQKDLQEALVSISLLPAEGIVVVAPHLGDADILESWSARRSVRLMSLDEALTDNGANSPAPALTSDYPQTGRLAARKMLDEARDRKWNLGETGAILFTSKGRKGLDQVTTAELQCLKKAGLNNNFIFVIPLAKADLIEARSAASTVLFKQKTNITNWFIGGSNDFMVVGGLRAAETDFPIGKERVIGVGVGGDGAIYDLQRPRKSGLTGSVLLPLDKLSAKAEHEMNAWIQYKVFPVNYEPLRGVYLNRDNVRELKAMNHLVD